MVNLSTQAFKSIFQHKLYPHMLKVTPELNGKLFLCSPQKQAKTQPVFKTASFKTKYKLQHIKLNICIQGTKVTSHKQYLLGLLLSKNAKKKTHKQKHTSIFYTLFEKKWVINLQKQQLGKTFSSVYILQIQLSMMNVFNSMG